MPETVSDEDQGGATPEAPASHSSQTGGGGKGRSLGFVVIFLIIAIGLLIGHHYSLTTDPMNWYLYQVARDTAKLLDVVGERGALESPRTAFTGRTAVMMREELREAGMRGVLDSAEGAEEPELTPWEIWQHRVLEFREQRDQLEDLHEHLEPVPRPTMETLEQHRAYLEDMISRLETAIVEHEPAGGVRKTLQDAQQVLEELDAARGSMHVDESAALGIMYEVEEGLTQAWAAQRQSVGRELAQLEQRVGKLGPRVEYVRQLNTRRALQWAREDLAALEAREDVGQAEKEAIQEKIAKLEERREAQLESDEQQPRGASFGFVVIPDCGAIPTMVIYLAAVLAFPARWWKRLAGVIMGLPILYGVNVFRLACLGVIGSYTGPGEQFAFYHHYVWQGIYILFVVALWLIWMEVLVKGRLPWPKKSAQ